MEVVRILTRGGEGLYIDGELKVEAVGRYSLDGDDVLDALKIEHEARYVKTWKRLPTLLVDVKNDE